jgi:hypothetical protein
MLPIAECAVTLTSLISSILAELAGKGVREETIAQLDNYVYFELAFQYGHNVFVQARTHLLPRCASAYGLMAY